jgi:rod shape-determining protein MreC
MLTGPAPNPLLWLALFVSLSVGATMASARHLLDTPLKLAQQVMAPLQTGTSRVGRAIGELGSGWQELNRLRADNAALRSTVEELTQEAVRLRSAELENRDLREQLKYSQSHLSQNPIAAEVIGRDTSSLLGYAVINRGAEAGLEDGMTIVTSAGLVGRIETRASGTSKVLLINTPSSSVNAVIQGQPGASGMVYGRPDGRLIMRYIPQAETIRVNDVVVTSGLGGAFPKDIAIGRVVQVEARDVDIFQQAIVEPFVNFRKLGQVLVLTGFKPIKL